MIHTVFLFHPKDNRAARSSHCHRLQSSSSSSENVTVLYQVAGTQMTPTPIIEKHLLSGDWKRITVTHASPIPHLEDHDYSFVVFSLQEGSQRISLCGGSGYGKAAPLQVLP